jgi:alanine dehydrogenase
MLRLMKPRSVIMDLAIDMGGCVETSRPTAFPNAAYEVDGVIHFCVPNLPAVAARASSLALTNALLPYLGALSEGGVDGALSAHADLSRGVYLYHGRCTHPALARAFDLSLDRLSLTAS